MSKHDLRGKLKKIRRGLSPSRRKEASLQLFSHLSGLLADKNYILSFSNFGSEIDISLFNFYLACTNRLFLPKVCKNMLRVFHVTNLKQLRLNSFGILEPNVELCIEVDISTIQMVLVPALGFDFDNHRLGYGKGFYDRLLNKNPYLQTVGIGFKEQLITKLPIEATDRALAKVSLF